MLTIPKWLFRYKYLFQMFANIVYISQRYTFIKKKNTYTLRLLFLIGSRQFILTFRWNVPYILLILSKWCILILIYTALKGVISTLLLLFSPGLRINILGYKYMILLVWWKNTAYYNIYTVARVQLYTTVIDKFNKTPCIIIKYSFNFYYASVYNKQFAWRNVAFEIA